MEPTALLPLRRKTCWGFFRPEKSDGLAGFEPANLGTKDQHATSRSPKPLILELQDVESFVEGFLGHQIWSSYCPILKILLWQEGAWVQIFCHISCFSPPLVYLFLLKSPKLFLYIIIANRFSPSSVKPWWLLLFLLQSLSSIWS